MNIKDTGIRIYQNKDKTLYAGIIQGKKHIYWHRSVLKLEQLLTHIAMANIMTEEEFEAAIKEKELR